MEEEVEEAGGTSLDAVPPGDTFRVSQPAQGRSAAITAAQQAFGR